MIIMIESVKKSKSEKSPLRDNIYLIKIVCFYIISLAANNKLNFQDFVIFKKIRKNLLQSNQIILILLMNMKHGWKRDCLMEPIVHHVS